jgi:signal transduction histidine kinase
MLNSVKIIIALSETNSLLAGIIIFILGLALTLWFIKHKPNPSTSGALVATATAQSTNHADTTAHELFPRFSATLIHDLKQPISAIQFNALAALRFIQSSDSGGHPAVTESLEDIKNDVARLSRLAQGLGAFLGVERGHDEVLDLNGEIETALSLLKGEMMKRQIKCLTNFGTLKHEFIWKRPILSRTVLSAALSLMDVLDETSEKNKTLNIRTNAQSADVIKIEFSAQSIFTKTALNLKTCTQDVLQRGGSISDSYSENSSLTITIELPFTPGTQA